MTFSVHAPEASTCTGTPEAVDDLPWTTDMRHRREYLS